MSEKTLNDYLKMMQDIEAEEDNEEEFSEDHDLDDVRDEELDDLDLDLEFEEGEDAMIDEDHDEEDEEGIEEGIEGDIHKAIDMGSYWNSTVGFLSYTTDCIDTFRDLIQNNKLADFITEEGDFYCTEEFMIIGISVEQGLMVVSKCTKEEEGEEVIYNALFYIKETNVDFVEFI